MLTGTYFGVNCHSNIIKCLGIFVGNDTAQYAKQNWEPKLLHIEKLLESWKSRNIAIFGKVTMLKSLAMSNTTFLATCVPILHDVVRRLNAMFYGFIWGEMERIRRKTLCAPTIQGGVNMIDIDSYFQSLSAVWVPRLLESKNENW